MGLFDGKPNAEKQTAKSDSAESSAKQNQIKSISGFDSTEEVREAARKVVESADKTAKPASTRSARQREIDKEREKEEKKQAAMQAVGQHIMGKVASIPYDVWARFAEDDKLKLTPEQHKELAQSYFLLAQTMNLDFSGPVALVIGIAVSNAVLVGERLKYLAEKEERAQQEAELQEARPN